MNGLGDKLDSVDNKIGTPSDTAANDTLFGQMKSITEDVIDAMSNISGSRMFTKDTEWTVPTGVKQVKLTGCAAGGVYYAGEYCYEETIIVNPGETIKITVGSGNTVFGSYKTLIKANCSTSFQNGKLGYQTGYNGGAGYKGVDGGWETGAPIKCGGGNGIGGAGGIGGAFGYGGGGGGGGGAGGYTAGSANHNFQGGSGGGAAGTAGSGSSATGYSIPGAGHNSGSSGAIGSGRNSGAGGSGGSSIETRGYGSGSGRPGSSGTYGCASGSYQFSGEYENYTVYVIQGTPGAGGTGGNGGGSNGFLLIEWG